MARAKKKIAGVATIDVELVEILVGDDSTGTAYAVDTANEIQVEPATEVQDAIKLIKNGRLLAQKRGKTTITGHDITLNDSLFSPYVVQILQGGTVTETTGFVSYTPPVVGSGEEGQIFQLVTYSACYDETGDIVQYEKTTYPNCKGSPISISRKDDEFSVPSYTITSTANKGQPPYKIDYVAELPDYSNAEIQSENLESDLVMSEQNETQTDETGLVIY